MRSRSFETKLRLEIGRYEFRSRGSKVVFFNSGRTIADFWLAGKLLSWAMEALHIIVITGAIVSQMFLSSHVGIGSREHCLAGSFLMMADASSTVAGEKLLNGTSACLLEMTGWSKLVVDCRMRLILLSKCWAKSSAECTAVVVSGCDSRHLRHDQSFLLSPSLPLILLDQ